MFSVASAKGSERAQSAATFHERELARCTGFLLGDLDLHESNWFFHEESRTPCLFDFDAAFTTTLEEVGFMNTDFGKAPPRRLDASTLARICLPCDDEVRSALQDLLTASEIDALLFRRRLLEEIARLDGKCLFDPLPPGSTSSDSFVEH